MVGKERLVGVLCGMAAGALWGLVFLPPELAEDFSPLQLAIGRYLAYGLLSIILIAPRWRGVAQLPRRAWLAVGWLGFTGNILYYILLSSAVQTGGIAMTSLVMGFLPILVTVVGSRDHDAVPVRRLLPSLAFCVAAAICIGWQAVMAPVSGTVQNQVVGLLCAFGAVASWTSYAIGNSRWLAREDRISAHHWSLLTGAMTGAQALALVPLSLLLDSTDHMAGAWARFAAVSAGVAFLASIVGNALWNRMSRLLPLTLVGQMILFETMFALLYGLVWEHRLPTLLESTAFALVVLSVLSCIAAHRNGTEHRANHRALSTRADNDGITVSRDPHP